MARREIQWASFGPGVRIAASTTEAPAVAKSESCRIFKDVVEGDVSVVVEDASLSATVVVPWHNVGSVVYCAVADVSKAPAAKAKSAEPLA